MMLRLTLPIILCATVAVAGCKGPNQRAGEKQDEAQANATGVKLHGAGPAERIGKARDQADRAAKDAQASAERDLKARRHKIEIEADTAADKLDDQADQLRKDARQKAAALK